MTTRTLPGRDEILAISQTVLGTMAGLQTDACEAFEIEGHRMTGTVQISGGWQGAVLLQTSREFTRRAAAAMLMTDADSLSEADLQDVLAELTNMIGGNIKSQVPGPSFLSIPTVTSGRDFAVHLSGARVVGQAAMDVAGHPLNVLICESVG